MSLLLDTLKDVQAKAAEHSAVLVAFSGGKDSLAVLDLCLRHFSHVECFHLEFIEGMRYTRERVSEPLAALRIPCHYYDCPKSLDAFKRGQFCDPRCDLNDFIEVPSYKQLYAEISQEVGIPLIATGKKQSDFPRRMLNLRYGREAGWHPIQRWRKKDVLDYLRLRGITPPEQHADAGGIDLTDKSLRWLREHYPDDYRLILKWFPHAEAAILRQELRERKQAAERSAGARTPAASADADAVQ